MIKIDTKLSGDVADGLEKFEAKIKESVIFSGVAAMALVIYEEVKLNASPPRMGRKSGNLSNSIYRAYSPEKSGDAVKVYRVSWNKAKAPHGHLLEYGTSRMRARPFIRPAFDHVARAARAGMARMKERMDER